VRRTLEAHAAATEWGIELVEKCRPRREQRRFGAQRGRCERAELRVVVAEIGPWVERLARRMAGFPPEALRLAKAAVNAATDRPLQDGLMEEAYLFQRLLRTDDAQRAMRRFLEIGGQTRDGELRVNELSGDL
jgi:enoyl-CoA hydratase/carnithine racemase